VLNWNDGACGPVATYPDGLINGYIIRPGPGGTDADGNKAFDGGTDLAAAIWRTPIAEPWPGVLNATVAALSTGATSQP
jgi:hypothetical protein